MMRQEGRCIYMRRIRQKSRTSMGNRKDALYLFIYESKWEENLDT